MGKPEGTEIELYIKTKNLEVIEDLAATREMNISEALDVMVEEWVYLREIIKSDSFTHVLDNYTLVKEVMENKLKAFYLYDELAELEVKLRDKLGVWDRETYEDRE